MSHLSSVPLLSNGGKGQIQIIFGPMFSGKTTELMRRLKRYQISKHQCLVIKYANDTRYDVNGIATHDQQVLPAVSATLLKLIKENALEYSVIGVDEGQFFPDTVEFAEEMANRGKIVIVAALDGTYQRSEFGNILHLVPLAESVVKLTAVCMICYEEASYTKRTSTETAVEVIGGCDKYIATCRRCYFSLTPQKHKAAEPLKPIQENMKSNDPLSFCKQRLLEDTKTLKKDINLCNKENSNMEIA